MGSMALVLAACAGSGAATTGPTTAAATTPAATQAAASTAAESPGESGTAGEAYKLDVAQDAKYGAILVGEEGKAVYLFTPDSANTSTCKDACADTWPPFLVGSGETAQAGTGVTGKITTFARADGSMQLAYNGIPLYYYSGDSASGQTNGQGLFDKWYLVSPEGTPIGAPASSYGKGTY